MRIANGQRYLSKGGPERERYSDPDASWGHRSGVSTRKGGGFYGYKLHAAVCTRTDLPLACRPSVAQIKQSKARTHNDVPTCEHGRWTFAGADFKRKATKRCPTGECAPKSRWIKGDRRNPLVPARGVGRDLLSTRGRAGVQTAARVAALPDAASLHC